MVESKQLEGSAALRDKSGPELRADSDKDGGAEPDAGLGKFLSTTRESRGVTCEDVVKQTRIPSHYLRMMESSDYSMISDQLYVLPFLRRYATFLNLDPEETAMRFVREVQRADNSAPTRMAEPVQAHRKRHRGWARMLAVVVAVVVIGWLYMVESEHRRMIAGESAAPVASVKFGASAATVPNASTPHAIAPASAAVPAAGVAGAAQAKPAAPPAAQPAPAIPSP